MNTTNWKNDLRNACNALKRFTLKMFRTKRLLFIMTGGVVSLFCMVVLYSCDPRLNQGPWNTYGNGLFSIVEGRNEQFVEFPLTPEFRQQLEKRGGAKLIGAWQKSKINEAGDVTDIQHINIFDLSKQLKGIFKSEASVSRKYFTRENPYFAEFDIKRIGNIHGHPAMAYKSHERDGGGYFSMGLVIIAHRRAYFYESYSHYSPYSDWQNDTKTYFFTENGYTPDTFTADNMSDIEGNTFLYAILLFAIFFVAGAMAHRSITRGIIHQGPVHPVVNEEAQQRYQWLGAFTIVLMTVMLVMVIAFWQYNGTKTGQLAAYVLMGIFIYCFNLPTSIHLYRKARGLR